MKSCTISLKGIMKHPKNSYSVISQRCSALPLAGQPESHLDTSIELIDPTLDRLGQLGQAHGHARPLLFHYKYLLIRTVY